MSDKRKENSTQEYQNNRRDINKKTGKHSVITEHRINNNRMNLIGTIQKYSIKKNTTTED